jgi:biotin synthase
MKGYNVKFFHLSTRMVSLARILCGYVNIAATTALQAINPQGREIALNLGANMLMPILTPRKYREDYQLYEGKPCIDERAEECQSCLKNRGFLGRQRAHFTRVGRSFALFLSCNFPKQ